MDTEQIDELKLKICRALEQDGGTYCIDDVFRDLEVGAMQAFSKNQTIVITQIVQAPRKRWLNIFVVAGSSKDAMSLQDEVMQFAADKGCEFMAMTGRKGWSKILPKFGWSEQSVSYAIPVRGKLNG